MNIAAHNRLGQKRARNYRHAYLATHPCVDCGETDISRLEFDHRNPAEKVNDVSSMHSIYRMQEEIAKCDVRCTSCHRARHDNARSINKTKVQPPLGNGGGSGSGGLGIW
jgi:hypothetical protein